MKAHISIEQKIIGSLAASLVILLGVGIISYWSVKNLSYAGQWVAHTQQVLSELEAGRAMVTDAESSQRAYLLTGDNPFLQDSRNAQGALAAWEGQIHDLTRDNPEQQQRLDILFPLIEKRFALLNNRIALRQKGGLEAAARAVATQEGRTLTRSIWERFNELRVAENQLLAEREDSLAHYTKLSLWAIVVGVVIACAIGTTALKLLSLTFARRKKIEGKLRESEELHRSMVENVKDYGIFMLDAKGRIISWNIGAQRIKGYQPGEIIGKHFSIFYPEEVVKSGFPEKELFVDRMLRN